MSEGVDEYRAQAKMYLRLAASQDATHIADRTSAPRCHPGTRKQVLDIINGWFTADASRSSVLWLTGPSGSGKSAIAQTVTENLSQSMIGSFFFTRKLSGRSAGKHVIATLALEALYLEPAVEGYILAAIMDDPFLFSRPLEHQMQKLFIGPLLSLRTTKRYLLVIDGIEECLGWLEQQAILSLFGAMASCRELPVFLLITSPNDKCFVDAFSSSFPKDIALHINLDDSFNPAADIRLLIHEGFDRLYKDNKMHIDSAGVPWPPIDAINVLVDRSSGLFIFAEMALKFIDAPSGSQDPITETSRFMDFWNSISLSSSGSRPLHDLDVLYQEILSRAKDRQVTALSFSALLVIDNKWSTTYEAIAKLVLCNLEQDITVKRTFQLTYPLVQSLRWREMYDIQVQHISVYEFLGDQARAGPFFVDSPVIHSALARGCLKVVAQFKSNPPTENNKPPVVDYAYLHWVYHLMHSDPSNEFLRDIYGHDIKSLIWELACPRRYFSSRISPPLNHTWPLSQSWHQAKISYLHGIPRSCAYLFPVLHVDAQ